MSYKPPEYFWFTSKEAINANQAWIIRKNWQLGKPWWLCSPMFNLTRRQIAEIVTLTNEQVQTRISAYFTKEIKCLR